MQEEKFGKLIKEIREKYHLTQKDIADKYHVTYQAVSKWENGKTIPDISIIREISRDFNISIEDMIDGNLKENKRDYKLLIILGFFIIIGLIITIIVIKANNNFESKTISSSCEDYKISGIISYNSTKSIIYIPKIEYCGEDADIIYHDIKCTLYETNGNLIQKIDDYEYHDKSVTLEEFMKLVSFKIDNYSKICRNPSGENFYLEIEAIDNNNKEFFHKIPLTVDEGCDNNE